MKSGKVRANMDRNPPSQWKVAHYADIGTEEPFVSRIALGLPEILNATLYSGREEIKEAIIGIVMDCLMPALMSLRELRAIAVDAKAWAGAGYPGG
jgi:hypothetical protein